MEKEFVPYTLALALKELGYNEQDFGYYRLSLTEEQEPFTNTELMFFRERYDNHNFRLEQHPQIKIGGGICSAPLYQQAFSFFREKYNLWSMIYPRDGWNYSINRVDETTSCSGESFHSVEINEYEEAELECLKKLIEIVKEK
jgi:hypothetical protein